MGLADYKDIIATAASTSSFCLLLSPSFLCLKIWKQGSSKGIPIYPLMESMARSILIFQQGVAMSLRPLIMTHGIGLVLNSIYITTYLSFTKDKTEAKSSMLRWASVLVPMIAYANYEDKALVGTRFPLLVTTFTTCLMLYHLYQVRDVLRTKDTKNLPFPIILAASVVTFLWTLYGFAINKPTLQFQTGFAFIVCAFELSLCIIYPSKPSVSKKEK